MLKLKFKNLKKVWNTVICLHITYSSFSTITAELCSCDSKDLMAYKAENIYYLDLSSRLYWALK